MSVPVFESGNTIQFTWVSTVGPDAPPGFTITEPWSASVVVSFSAVQSSATSFFALYTMPTSEGHYLATWTALKTDASSVRAFIDRLVFKVTATAIPG